MKRLLDETPDEFERSLLRAGSEVEPSGPGKARLLSAIAAGTLGVAAGTAVGRAASLPWWKPVLATKLGQTTLIGFVAAGAGTALVVLQQPEPNVNVNLPGEVGVYATHSGSNSAPRQPAPPVSDVPPVPEAAPQVSGLATAPSPTAVEQRALATTPSRVNRTKPSSPAPAESAAAAPSAGPSPLVLEARLVERMRSAMRNGQAAVAEGLLAEYRQKFPDGQLGPEVNKLESQWRAH